MTGGHSQREPRVAAGPGPTMTIRESRRSHIDFFFNAASYSFTM